MLSPEFFVIVPNVVWHNIVPEEDAFKIPASTSAPVAVPAGNVAVAVTTLPDATYDVNATLPSSVPNVVSPITGIVELLPTAI